MEQTLLLNATYEPVKVINWQRAMTLWVSKKVEILETHDREVRAVTFSFKLPSVVRLLRYARIRHQDRVPFTRANIYGRDEYACQYCGETFDSEDLTFDHVIPVAHGGIRCWENIVTACVPCNKKKGGRTPAEAVMPLRRQPRRPASALVLRVTVGMRKAPETWRDYLYWNLELDKA